MSPPAPDPVRLTDEQQAVVHHDPAEHATVLAVAGSGKTTAMAHRIRHLVAERGVPPAAIRAVMFNRAARHDFARKLDALAVRGVRVQTFNALGHAIVGWAAREGLCEPATLLDEGDAARLVEQAIRDLRRGGGDAIDPDAASAAIRAWKGLLTPPDHARCTAEPALVEVYRRFEALRVKARRMTFDDQIGEAVRLLETSPVARRALCDRLEHLVIDEFQDVNHAQQRLAQLIAGERARVMVVGDDDQCIYEWRGARSAYIKRAFAETFTAHAHRTYRLTRSFRFGPGIARVAAQAIAHNTDRVAKPLVAADPLAPGAVRLAPPDWDPVAEIRRLAAEGAAPADVVVLVRVFSQSYPLQAAFIGARIPFVVDGERSLLEATAVRALRSYLWLAHRVDAPLDADAIDALEAVVDKPTRYVKKRGFSRAIHRALAGGATVGDCLRDAFAFEASGVSQRAAEALAALADTLDDAARAGAGEGGAAAAVDIIRRDVDFAEWLAEWQSPEKVEAGMATLDAFTGLLRARAVPLAEVEPFVAAHDTRLGLPDAQCVRVTSVFRAKGLEWPHVLLPAMAEGACPHLRDDDPVVEDVLAPERALPPTERVEAERRLFYVAVTRARASVLIGLPRPPAEPSRFIDEALPAPTAAAVATLHGITRAGALSPAAADALRRAARHPALRAGLLGLVDRLIEREPGATAALDRARLALREPAEPAAAPGARRGRPLSPWTGPPA